MTVYVDDMRAKFGRMIMCHLIADSTDELLTMVGRIGVQRKWIQHAGRPDEHFDIAVGKRDLAIAAGATTITHRQCGCMIMLRKRGLPMGKPEDAEDRVAKLFEDISNGKNERPSVTG